MTQITFVQDLIARLDQSLPWLLPTLEAIELAVPLTARLLICASLMAWLAVRHHQAATVDRLHGVTL